MESIQMSIPRPPETKLSRMNQLTSAIENFLEIKSDDSANTIMSHLQALSLTIDLSIFDPSTNAAIQFFMSLYNLMNKMEQRSPFAWHCVDVLSNVCRNPAARQSLIENYHFIPSLSRLLSVQLILEKKIKLLRLMQDLSCGIKMSWQIPYLSHLMSTLSQLIETSGDEEIVALSLGVVVNLCYKNLPAIYTLMGNVDVKKLLRVCSSMHGTVEIYTCKLIIILDCVNGQVPKATLAKLMQITVKTIIKGYHQKDSLLMRQVVDFFLDVVEQHNHSLSFINNGDANENDLKELVSLIESNDAMDTDEDTSLLDFRHPECMALIFQFFHTLVEGHFAGIAKTYPVLVQTALRWIQTELVSSQALALLTAVVRNSDELETGVLEPLAKGLPVFLTILKHKNDDALTRHIEYSKKMAGLLNLLTKMVHIPSIRSKILEDLQTETVCKLFTPLMSDDNLTSINDLSTMDVNSMYVHAITLIASLASHDVHWMALQDRIVQLKQILDILAQGLYFGSDELKKLVLQIIQVNSFPVDSFSKVLTNVNQRAPEEVKRTPSQAFKDLSFPALSMAQIHRLDDVLQKFRGAVTQNPFTNTSTSEVMELYEYKLTSMSHENRAAMASVEAATERCTYLQHRIAQLSGEVNRFHQLLYKAEQCQEQTLKIKESLSQDIKELSNKAEADRGKIKACKSQLSIREEELKNLRSNLEETTKRLNEVGEAKRLRDEEVSKLNDLINKLEANSIRLENQVQKKDDLLKKANGDIESLNLELKELQRCLKEREAELRNKNIELSNTQKELLARKQILDTITKVASNANNTQFS